MQTSGTTTTAIATDPRLLFAAVDNHILLNNHQHNQYFNTDLVHVDNVIDQARIDTWLLDKNKLLGGGRVQQHQHEKKPSKVELSIHTAKKLLRKCICTLSLLEETQARLRANVTTMSSAEWKQRTIDMGLLKDEFNKSLLKFEDANNLVDLKKLIWQRRKKRTRQKNQRVQRKANAVVAMKKRQVLHKAIDAWQKQQQEADKKALLDEKMQNQTDCILYDVTRKKTDAKRHLSLISALVKLRTIRESMAQQCGETTSSTDRQAFGTVTEKLIRIWENALQKYTTEEAALKAKLEFNASANSEAINRTKQQTTIDAWRSVLFGTTDQHQQQSPQNPVYWALTSAERDLETFVAIRKSWDTFLLVSADDDSSSSSIPLSWITPPLNPVKCSDSPWLKYISSSSSTHNNQ